MFGWLFGKKKVNGLNASKSALLKEEISQMSPRKRVKTLRRLRGIHTHDSSIDFMYADDMIDDCIMLYLLMDMVDVVSEDDAGFYEVEESVVEAEVSPEGAVGEEVKIEDMTDVEPTPIVEETPEIPSIYAAGGSLDMTKIDEEPTPIAVEETVIEQAPIIEEEAETLTFGDSFDSSGFDRGCSGSDYDSDDGGCDSD